MAPRRARASGAGSVNEAVMKLLGVPGRLDTAGGGNYSLDLRGFGGTADLRRLPDEPVRDTRWVAGLRVWF